MAAKKCVAGVRFEGPDGETVRWERRPLTVEGEWETEDASGKTLAIKATAGVQGLMGPRVQVSSNRLAGE